MENKFKVGDKVLLKNERGGHWNSSGKMDKYKGQIVTITEIRGSSFYIEEDCGENGGFKWSFEFDNIERIANDITLSDLQFADILTLRNGEKYVVADGCMLGEDYDYYCDNDEIEDYYNDDLTRDSDDIDDRQYDIVKVERAGQVIYERETTVEITIAEISEKLGYEVKVVKEK